MPKQEDRVEAIYAKWVEKHEPLTIEELEVIQATCYGSRVVYMLVEELLRAQAKIAQMPT